MQAKEYVTYQYLEEYEIHEFIFAESSRRAMDDYIGFIYEIYDDYLKDKEGMRIILDIHESGMLPLRYASGIMKKIFEELQPFPKPYIAYLYDESIDQTLINSMGQTTSVSVTRLDFLYKERDTAIEWLMTKSIS